LLWLPLHFDNHLFFKTYIKSFLFFHYLVGNFFYFFTKIPKENFAAFVTKKRKIFFGFFSGRFIAETCYRKLFKAVIY